MFLILDQYPEYRLTLGLLQGGEWQLVLILVQDPEYRLTLGLLQGGECLPFSGIEPSTLVLLVPCSYPLYHTIPQKLASIVLSLNEKWLLFSLA